MTAQTGILLEGCKAGIYLEANVTVVNELPAASRAFIEQLKVLQTTFPDAHLGATVAFSDRVWKQLSPASSAPELKPFVTLGKGNLIAPATQYDLLVHIQSNRPDVNFTLAQAAVKSFQSAVEIQQEIHGFRWVEERDLTGFIDGTENPKVQARAEVGLIANGEDADGSYVFTQRWNMIYQNGKN